jgi:hypothetical protein
MACLRSWSSGFEFISSGPHNATFPIQVHDSRRDGRRGGRRRRPLVIGGRVDDPLDIADHRGTRDCRSRRAVPSWACAGVLRGCRNRRLHSFPLFHIAGIRPRGAATLSPDSAITSHNTSRRCWRLRREPLLPLLQKAMTGRCRHPFGEGGEHAAKPTFRQIERQPRSINESRRQSSAAV